MPDFFGVLEEARRQAPALTAAFAFIFGACLGSFLNVVVHRLPRGQKLTHPPSTCACGQRIRWHDNVPILGWLLLGGRARCCGRRYGVRYPVVEALTGTLFLAAWLHHPAPVALAGMVFICLMLCAGLIDWDTMEIPDRFSLGGFCVAFALSVAVPALHGVTTAKPLVAALQGGMFSLAGALVGAGLIFLIAAFAAAVLKREGMGMGDVKLLAAIGAFGGWEMAVFAVFGGSFLGLLSQGLRFVPGFDQPVFEYLRPPPPGGSPEPAPAPAKADEPAGEGGGPFGRPVPFGPALAGAAVLYFLGLKAPVEEFLGLGEILRVLAVR